MAPEYFPFVGFVALVALAFMALGTGITLVLIARHSKGRSRVLRVSSIVAFSGVVVLVLAVLMSATMIRQQFFLNEPLVTACAKGDIVEAERLLSRGASPDAYGVDFMQTALIAAAESGHREIVALLLRRGANVRLRDSGGKTALERARERGDAAIIRVLEQSEAEGEARRER